ncbi:MAG: hypothetical protein ACREQK_03260 [Candidatus Binatia bacterium]
MLASSELEALAKDVVAQPKEIVERMKRLLGSNRRVSLCAVATSGV